MSALQRSSRSRSKPAQQSDEPIQSQNSFTATIPPSPDLTARPSSAHSSSLHTLSDQALNTSNTSPEEMSETMIEQPLMSGALLSNGALDAGSTTFPSRDDRTSLRSSSLSDVGEDLEAPGTSSAAEEIGDEDSEAETERLDQTPRNLRTVGATATIVEAVAGRSPSKLGREIPYEHESSAIASPDTMSNRDHTPEEDFDEGSINPIAKQLPFGDYNRGIDDNEFNAKKRKRLSPGDDVSTDEADEPARKRSGSSKGHVLNGREEEDETLVDNSLIIREDADRLAQADLEEDVNDEIPDENDEIKEPLPIPEKKSHKKQPKGKRKGKKIRDEDAEQLMQTLEHREGEIDEIADEEADEDGSTADEERARRGIAKEKLSEIEKHFTAFRSRLLEERIAAFTNELELLNQPNSTHPALSEQTRCVDIRRDEKIQREADLLELKTKELIRKTLADRCQYQSQYFQTVREARDRALDACNYRLNRLQRERRHWGADEPDYAFMYHPDRAVQIRYQQAYNNEVSILAGVQKYVGFPAAPEILGTKATEAEDDFRAMKISPRPVTIPRPFESREDRTAGEQFLEQTPWANPMHPVHALGPYNSSHQARLPNADFMTPANQRHLVDLHAPNGSASTVELASNPPSSAAAPSTVLPEHLQSRLPIESPSLPSKRLPLSGEPSKLDNVLISSPIPHRTPAPALASSIDRPGSGHPTEMYENSTFEPPAATFGPAQADGLTATDRDEVEHLVRTPLPQAGVTALL